MKISFYAGKCLLRETPHLGVSGQHQTGIFCAICNAMALVQRGEDVI